MKTQDYIREFFMIFFIRKQIILAIMAAVVFAGVAITLLASPVYQAESAVVLKGGQVLDDPTGVGEGADPKIDAVTEKDLFSEIEILSSFSVFRRATEQLAEQGRYGLSPDQSAEIRRFAGNIASGFEASIVPRSNVINARLEWGDPQAAEDVLAAVLDAYLAQRQQVYNPAEAQQFFKTQMESYQDNLAAMENRLLNVADGQRLSDLEQQVNANVQMIADMQTRLADLRTDRLKQQKLLAFLEQTVNGGDKKTFFYSSIDNMALGDLAREVQGLYVDEAEVLQTYKAGTDRANAVQRQVNRMQGMLQNEAQNIVAKERATLDSLNGQIELIDGKISELRAENRELNRSALKARQIQRQIDITEGTMRTFDKRFQEARIKSETSSDLFSVSVVENPQAGPEPTFPNPKTILPASILLGILLGLTVGFLLEFFDHRFKRPEDLTNYAGIPCTFSVPEYS
ncbi:GumC family protein [Rhodovibrio salinarum]|uniref:Polysaccharide chain length determinant N-terminal domain-containing protein n=1 Tax=Rhodovibrio salinarum TaxID=1087 RepID=A0A934QH02_9PROT|nr:Wzz/FepE/Etk N-terminal domain-containing protein [Rhodovibrio salinarum]MBK1696380.1 hypothetical protein [Rhodovibrio salinarum]